MARRVEMDRAACAWQRVHDEVLMKENAEVHKVYGTRARDLTALIHTDGLGQTLAFLLAKSKAGDKDKGKPETPSQLAHRLLFQHISVWVLQQVPSPGGIKDHLLLALIAGESTYYRRATVETLAFAGWLKKFAEAEFGNEIVDVDR